MTRTNEDAIGTMIRAQLSDHKSLGESKYFVLEREEIASQPVSSPQAPAVVVVVGNSVVPKEEEKRVLGKKAQRGACGQCGPRRRGQVGAGEEVLEEVLSGRRPCEYSSLGSSGAQLHRTGPGPDFPLSFTSFAD